MSCTLSNIGRAAISTISYSAITGATVSGPTGACAASATCGTVTVATGTAQGTYSGTLTATPNTGSAASASVSLAVNPPSTLGTFGNFYGYRNPYDSSITVTNTGSGTISGIAVICRNTSASITSGAVSTLAPYASMTVYSTHPYYAPCVYIFKGTNASNSGYVDSRY